MNKIKVTQKSTNTVVYGNKYPDDLKYIIDRDIKPYVDNPDYIIEITDLTKELELKKIHDLRQQAYPPIGEQLDMIFHNGLDSWKIEIQKIKDKYPKPE